MNLTVDTVRELVGGDVRTIKALDAAGKDIKHVHDISSCLELQRLDLSRNQLHNFKRLTYCTTLTWLSLAHNQIESLAAVKELRNLRILNASHNNITKCGDLSTLKELRALILNNNELTLITGLHKLTQLNTLVLSHNSIEEVDISQLVLLKKLSLSHNALRKIPDTKTNYELTEIRLNSNKITELNSQLQYNKRLRVIDIGNNRIRNVTILTELKGLRNVNIKGNPLCSEEGYTDTIQQMIPSLEVLDGAKVGVARGGAIKKKSKSTVPKPVEKPVIPVISDEDTPTTEEQEGVVSLTSEASGRSHGKRPRGKSGVVKVETVKKRKKDSKGQDLLTVAMETSDTVGVGGASAWD